MKSLPHLRAIRPQAEKPATEKEVPGFAEELVAAGKNPSSTARVASVTPRELADFRAHLRRFAAKSGDAPWVIERFISIWGKSPTAAALAKALAASSRKAAVARWEKERSSNE